MGWSRRQVVVGIGFVAGAGAGFLLRLAPTSALSACLLRPPGARAEPDFLAACLRCGQCVEACPFGTLHLMVGADAGIANGTPYLDSRKVPCYLCQGYDDLKCVTACPTSALEPVADLPDIRMGVAVIDERVCLAYNGTICRTCWHACPFPNEAITFDQRLRPVVNTEACIGCGLCDYVCPTESSSIPIRPACANGATAGSS